MVNFATLGGNETKIFTAIVLMGENGRLEIKTNELAAMLNVSNKNIYRELKKPSQLFTVEVKSGVATLIIETTSILPVAMVEANIEPKVETKIETTEERIDRELAQAAKELNAETKEKNVKPYEETEIERHRRKMKEIEVRREAARAARENNPEPTQVEEIKKPNKREYGIKIDPDKVVAKVGNKSFTHKEFKELQERYGSNWKVYVAERLEDIEEWDYMARSLWQSLHETSIIERGM